MKTKLEQLKKEIQRLRPEIQQGWTTTEIIEKLSGKEIYRSKSVKGRPITLDDVLLCCIKAYSKFGIITKKSYEEMFGGVVGLWDFTKDFDNQSEEFYDEIMFLLQ
jgi:hypothetical protein